MKSKMGFVEISHTADRSIRVWALNMTDLFAQSALGLYAVMEAQFGEQTCGYQGLELDGEDETNLLANFLNSLVFYCEHHRVGFTSFDFHISKTHISSQMKCFPIINLANEIKAVTYHHLEIQHNASRLEVVIVFDV